MSAARSRAPGVVLGTLLLGVLGGCYFVTSPGDYSIACTANGIKDKLMPTVRACALLRGCLPSAGEPMTDTISDCITADQPHRAAYLACALETTATCDSLARCFGTGFTTSAECSKGETSAKCSGNKAVSCRTTFGYYFDCDATGGSCETITNAAGAPASVCRVLPTCADANFTSHCAGNTVYACVNGKGYGQDCRNNFCDTRGSQTGCFFHGDTCGADATGCDGANVLHICSGGHSETFDCGARGLTCAFAGSNANCLAPACSLTSTCKASCDADGKTAHFCVGNGTLDVDCTTLSQGFTQCFTAKRKDGTLEPICL